MMTDKKQTQQDSWPRGVFFYPDWGRDCRFCNGCKLVRTMEYWGKDSDKSDKYYRYCKICNKEKARRYYHKSNGTYRAKRKKLYLENAERIRSRRREYDRSRAAERAVKKKELYRNSPEFREYRRTKNVNSNRTISGRLTFLRRRVAINYGYNMPLDEFKEHFLNRYGYRRAWARWRRLKYSSLEAPVLYWNRKGVFSMDKLKVTTRSKQAKIVRRLNEKKRKKNYHFIRTAKRDWRGRLLPGQ